MTVVNPKSISGISSITTGSGSDDLLTIHTNNTTERVRINSSGLRLPDSQKLMLGDTSSGDLQISHDGTNSIINNAEGSLLLQNNGTSSFYITNAGLNYLNNDTVFVGANKNIVFDKSENELNILGDNSNQAKLTFGDAQDLQIYKGASGSNPFIHNATGNLNITQNSGTIKIDKNTGDEMAHFNIDGSVELFHNSIKKFETTADGILTQGTILHRGAEGGTAQIRIEADEGDDNADKWRLISQTDGTFDLQNNASGSYETNISATGNGAVELYHDNSRRLQTFDLGIDIGTSATGNFGIRWGGANTNYANIWTEYGSGDIFIAGGLKQKGTNAGFFSSYGDSFSRNAIQVNAFGNSGIQFYASAAQNVAKDSAITVNEIARINQHGLTFGGESAAAHALDDYEEGSFTPTLLRASSNPSASFYTQHARYTKIGNLVHVQIMVDAYNVSGGSGQWQMGNFPFATENADLGYNNPMTNGRIYLDGDFAMGVDGATLRATYNTSTWVLFNQDDDTAVTGNFSRVILQGSITYRTNS